MQLRCEGVGICLSQHGIGGHRCLPVQAGRQGIGAGLGGAEGRDAVAGQQGERFLSVGRQKRREGLAPGLLGAHTDHRFDRQCRLELGRRAGHRQYRIAKIRLHQAAQYRGVFGGCRSQREVDDRRRAQGDALSSHVLDEGRRRDGRIDAQRSEPVDDHRRPAAGGAHHGDARSGLPGLRCRRTDAPQQRCDLEQSLDLVDPHDAVRAKKGIEGSVFAGDRTGVRDRKLRAHLGAAELVDNDCLADTVGGPCGRRQQGRIAQGLQEQRDHIGVRIINQHRGDFTHTDISLIAHRHQAGKPAAPCLPARQQCAQHRAALRHHRHTARGCEFTSQRGIDGERHAADHVDHTDAVRAQQSHAELARTRSECCLLTRAFRTGFGKSVGEDGHHWHLLATAGFECLGHIGCRHHHEGMVDRTGHAVEVRKSLLAEEFAAGAVDRPDGPGPTVTAQKLLRAGGVLAGIARGADERHRARLENRVKQRIHGFRPGGAAKNCAQTRPLQSDF